ncbi:hypothetical protein BKA64DRAFT_143049 [Cadophora sp. MPI-SDFR-AT-0126]|nr:hypothetical protein BKA64DRAFT_143049 [Leotiomycetes sp. MPI-SDFR-AT-0126]
MAPTVAASPLNTMASTSTRTTKSFLVILSVLYFIFFPLVPRPLNKLILPTKSTSVYYQHLIGFILCEQCSLLIFHRFKTSRIIIVSLCAVVFNFYALWTSGNAHEGRGSVAEWNVLIDVVRNMGILFMARDISRRSFAGSGSKSQYPSPSSSSEKSNSPPRISHTFPWNSCILWTFIFGTSAWYNFFGFSSSTDTNSSQRPKSESGLQSRIFISQLSHEQFQTVWNVLFARIVFAIPWRSIALGVTTEGEVRMMVFNTREKRACGVEGCGFGWDEEFMDLGDAEEDTIEERKGARTVLEERGVNGKLVGSEGKEPKGKNKEEKNLFAFSCNLNALLSMLGGFATIVMFGWGMGWAVARGIDRYFS